MREEIRVAERLADAGCDLSGVHAATAGVRQPDGGAAVRRWREYQMVWGETVCEAPGCFAVAEVLAEHDEALDEGVPVCVDCCGLLFERAAAVAIYCGDQLSLPSPFEGRS